jgi:hypothetical protein
VATCVKCMTAEVEASEGRAAVCKDCRAEMLLTGEGPKLNIMDRVHAGAGVWGSVEPTVRETIIAGDLRQFCERCNRAIPYRQEVGMSAVWCDDCGKRVCREECAEHVRCAFVTSGGETIDQNADRFLCKVCRAGRVLGGWKVQRIVTNPDGTMTILEAGK